ncbi:hypothetical protein VIBNISOn1_810009 [Vibrio nigripulchritudo SOn1]|uniref:Uncharacterized protein n=1 Tax=Vibrio nigripulchritudo SOn1 TaxID=1238450 RepID=A0AAV2VXA0_9VIBR|nr:hypothetical protein [Vibrio nigripulchritudo]CCO49311.1 hypothetical protein VIBNISOn1_810009 [Vibrio nigripulchritudo SOn1]
MIKKTLVSLGLVFSVLALPVTADTLDKYTQLFNTYHNQLEHGTWGLVDFTPSGPQLTPDNPAAYTSGRTLLFEPRWTKRTMRHVLGQSEYQYLESTIGEEEVRRRINNHCEAQLEVGRSKTYGQQYKGGGFLAELDSDTSHCPQNRRLNVGGTYYPLDFSNNPSAVNIRTFVPTVPGAKYRLVFKYQRRAYTPTSQANNYHRDLVTHLNADITSAKVNDHGGVGVSGHRLQFPIQLNDSNLIKGFNKAVVHFTADRFYTPLVFRDKGLPDSYGMLLKDVKVFLTEQNPNKQQCELLYPPGSAALQDCLNGGSTGVPSEISCNLNIDSQLGNFVVNEAGERIASEPWRDDPQNVLSTSDFYSVGKGGVSTFNMSNNGQLSACPIYNKRVRLEEFTSNNWDYERYAEQGYVHAKLNCLAANGTRETSWVTLGTERTDNLLITQGKIDQTFNDAKYQSCFLLAFQFEDRTHIIPTTQAGYDENSDGYDIRALTLN